MRYSSLIALAALCGAVYALPAAAMSHQGSAAKTNASAGDPTAAERDVKTADSAYASPAPLAPQTVLSWGPASRPGPRNRHVTPPHGGPVTIRDRSEIPGRT
jgi:hypothetical protein